MKKVVLCVIVCVLLVGLYACESKENKKTESTESKITLSQLGWKLGAQAYTFRNFSFFEAVDKINELGLHYVEAYPGQQVGNGVDSKMTYDLDKATRDTILNYLKKQDVTLAAYGVVTPKTQLQWDSLFTFADEMGISTITSEPPRDDLPYVSKLADEYDIDIAIHNHPSPSPYWSPDTLLSAIEGQSAHIGACADLGHWIRSGLDPVKSLKKLEGHIKELHIKDVNSNNSNAEDTIWGTGVIDMNGVTEELKRQNFKGMLSIEYESNPQNNMSQIGKSINYLQRIVAGLNEKN